jgi:hypothetical protein
MFRKSSAKVTGPSFEVENVDPVALAHALGMGPKPAPKHTLFKAIVGAIVAAGVWHFGEPILKMELEHYFPQSEILQWLKEQEGPAKPEPALRVSETSATLAPGPAQPWQPVQPQVVYPQQPYQPPVVYRQGPIVMGQGGFGGFHHR